MAVTDFTWRLTGAIAYTDGTIDSSAQTYDNESDLTWLDGIIFQIWNREYTATKSNKLPDDRKNDKELELKFSLWEEASDEDFEAFLLATGHSITEDDGLYSLEDGEPIEWPED